MSELKGAIVGYGLAGSVFHAPLISSTPGLAVATVVTGDPGRREQALRDHPGARVVSTPEELWRLADEHDFVVIAAPNDAHVPLAERALDAGLAVVVDKPLAPSAQEAAALVEHARARGTLLTVFQNRRWDSDHLTLRKLLAEGTLGDVLRFESRFERWRPEPRADAWRETAGPGKGGGVLLDLGSHLVDQALQLFGPASHVYARNRQPPRRRPATTTPSWRCDTAPAPTATCGCRRSPPLPGRACACSERAPPTSSRRSTDRRTRCGPAGARTIPSTWGIEPESRWGRLVKGDESEAVPSEPGAWPAFYAELERALRAGRAATRRSGGRGRHARGDRRRTPQRGRATDHGAACLDLDRVDQVRASSSSTERSRPWARASRSSTASRSAHSEKNMVPAAEITATRRAWC